MNDICTRGNPLQMVSGFFVFGELLFIGSVLVSEGMSERKL